VFAEIMVPPLRRVTFGKSARIAGPAKSNQKRFAPGWARLRRVPSPKSRLAVFEPFAYEDQDQRQEQIKGFPAEAGPTGHRVHSVAPWVCLIYRETP
jgi:hypothetical protein